MEEIMAIIQRELNILDKSMIPIKTGNLRSAIKIIQTSATSFRVYLDEEQAPYAQDVEKIKPYWRRLAMNLSYRLTTLLQQRQ